MSGMRHRQIWVCPRCGEKVYVVAEGISRNYMRSKYRASLLQMGNHKDEIYLREYYVAWDFTDIRDMRPRLQIMSVTHLNRATGKAVVYRQKWASYWFGHRLIPPEESIDTTWSRQSKPLGWNSEIPLHIAPDIQSSRFARVLESCTGFSDATNKLIIYGKYPAVEYIKASGFPKLYQELIDKLGSNRMKLEECPLNLKAKTLQDLFRLTKQDIRMLSPHNPGMVEIATYHAIKQHGGKINDELLELVFQIEQYQWRMVDALAFASPQKIINYLCREFENAPDDYGELYFVLQTWTDYLQDAVKLGYDLSARNYLFPKNLLEFHRKTTRYVKHLADPAKERRIREISDQYAHLCYEDAETGLLIRPALGAREIIKEGGVLHHCVGGYVDRVLQGECLILLLRQAEHPKKPYFTLEYMPDSGKVMQCHGMHHQQPDTVVKQFTNSWLRYIQEQPAAA